MFWYIYNNNYIKDFSRCMHNGTFPKSFKCLTNTSLLKRWTIWKNNYWSIAKLLILDISNTQCLKPFGISNKCLGPLAIYYSSKANNYSASRIFLTFCYLKLISKPFSKFILFSLRYKETINKYVSIHIFFTSKFRNRTFSDIRYTYTY